MKTSTLTQPVPPGLHVAVIMDGNGRWAAARGLPRTAGHRAGKEAVRRTVEAAAELGVGTLTLYAFSADNWKRPVAEVRALLELFGEALKDEARRCAAEGIRLVVLGRRDRLPGWLVRRMAAAERATSGGARMVLRLAIDYSSRAAILDAARRWNGDAAQWPGLLSDPPAPDVDLLIRTSGEQRLSDFLLWECAYAELYFTPLAWPDFGREALSAALETFARRERRFGALSAAIPA
jgi:undecaprenyl diphosphate synthase